MNAVVSAWLKWMGTLFPRAVPNFLRAPFLLPGVPRPQTAFSRGNARIPVVYLAHW